MRWSIPLAMILACREPASAQQAPKKILYLYHSAGFRHDSILTARDTLQGLAPGRFEVTGTEDLSFLTAERLREFAAVFFFTSGELAISAQQKADLLAFIRNGGGFAGAHSATDTLYSWPEYGDLIGGYFDGHPHVGDTDIDIEDPDHAVTRPLGNAFRILDEIYKFRDFSRERTRVLMTLRASPTETGINRAEYPLDSPLAWVRPYGQGRVFYTALGHFEETWRDPRVQEMLRNVLAWITREADGDATPRTPVRPRIDRVENVAAPGALISVHGANLTTGSTMAAAEPAVRLAGAWASLGGLPLRLVFASPERLDLIVPANATAQGEAAMLRVMAGPETNAAAVAVRVAAAAPRVLNATVFPGQINVQLTGVPDVAAARFTLDGVELESLGSFAVKPGVTEVLVGRGSSVMAGDRMLMVEAGGRTASIRLRID